MTQQVKMPEPAFVRAVPNQSVDQYSSEFMAEQLFNAAQMEAYAAARVREALAWQPIETAPKDGSRVLAWMTVPVLDEDTGKTEYQSNEIIAYWFLGDWMAYPAPPRYLQGQLVTHWMPLPPPPTKESKNG